MRAAIQFIHDHLQGPLVGVEVGVEKGDHSLDIATNLRMDCLFCVDPWVPFVQEHALYWKGISENLYDETCMQLDYFPHVYILRMFSIEAAKLFVDHSLDFVYIDANHEFGSIKEDIVTWLPKIRKGGVLSGHDYCDKWPGVKRGVDRMIHKFGLELFHDHDPKTRVDDWWCVI